MSEKIILEVKVPRLGEETPEAAQQLFANLAHTLPQSNIFRLGAKKKSFSLEIAGFDQSIHFYIATPEDQKGFLESLILAQYPLALITPIKELIPQWAQDNAFCGGQMVTGGWQYLPIRTYKDFSDVDPLSSVLAVLSKLAPDEKLLIQLVVTGAPRGWSTKGKTAILAENFSYDKSLVESKLSLPYLHTDLRVLAATPDELRSKAILKTLSGAFGGFASGGGNYLKLKNVMPWQRKKFLKSIILRQSGFSPRGQVLNVAELATLWHLPSLKLTVPNINWGRTIPSEPPDTLPSADGADKGITNFFAKTEFKNAMVNFGIKKNDRRKHIYVVGKTGTGKSTLIANMSIDDMRKGEGFAVVDPHGDLCEIILNYVPSFRINDVVYLDPSDVEHPFALNPLEIRQEGQKELVASGIVSVFHKLYGTSWGPRLEYILRNCILTLLEFENATFLEVPKLLGDSEYRHRMIEKISDPVLKAFWFNEFEKMPPNLRSEAISPILNKIGQFLSSKMIRNIIGQPKSSIDLRKIMDEGKILLVNLSQGKIGEDSSALLGAMIITQIQLAAMSRIYIAEEERKDFYLYVDEFQNFATTSFIKILSEARKYRLCLLVANQYLAQVDPEILSAILGNVGTIVSFAVGAADAGVMSKEFGQVYTEADLTGLSNFQLITRMTIDSINSRPFFAYSLPLPASVTQSREKVLRVSQERYTQQPL
jgi:hypothetical protein